MTERHTRTTGVGNRNLERSVSMLNFVRLANFIIKKDGQTVLLSTTVIVLIAFAQTQMNTQFHHLEARGFFLQFRVNAARVL